MLLLIVIISTMINTDYKYILIIPTLFLLWFVSTISCQSVISISILCHGYVDLYANNFIMFMLIYMHNFILSNLCLICVYITNCNKRCYHYSCSSCYSIHYARLLCVKSCSQTTPNIDITYIVSSAHRITRITRRVICPQLQWSF